MLKTRVTKVTAAAGVLLVAVVALIIGSKLHFPFLHPRESLSGYLERDFAAGLPASAAVEEAYWVGFRDSEAVFKLRMTPQDALGFVAKLQGIALSKEHWRTTPLDLRVSRPEYDPPPWWNNPPLKDGQALDIIISDGAIPRCHYLLVYAQGTGTMYLVRGGR